MDSSLDDDNLELSDIEATGLITLFDGQKQYPIAKVSVEFLFVEHTQFNCIEIIGTCVPTTVRANNQSSHPSGGTTPRPSGGHGATSSATVSANANASEAVARPPSSVSDDNPCYQVVRTYVTAKDFYDKIISDKKAKDKKNRRAEQAMSRNSKLTQNMAVTVLLGAISVGCVPQPIRKNSMVDIAKTYLINVSPVGGVRFERPKPPEEGFTPYRLASEKTAKLKEREKEKERVEMERERESEVEGKGSYRVCQIPHTLAARVSSGSDRATELQLEIPGDDSHPSSTSSSAPLADQDKEREREREKEELKMFLTPSISFYAAISKMSFVLKHPSSVGETLDAVGKDAAALETASTQAKASSSLFASTIDSIKEMFDFRATNTLRHSRHSPRTVSLSATASPSFREKERDRDREKNSANRRKRHKDPSRPIDREREDVIEKIRQDRYSMLLKPTHEYDTFQELQTAGREGPGGGSLVVNKTPTPTSSPKHSQRITVAAQSHFKAKQKAEKQANASAAKAILTAAGFGAGQLQNKKMIEIGGHVIPLKRTDLIPNMPIEKDKEKEKEREKHRAVPRMSFKGSRVDGETEGEGDADCAASKCGSFSSRMGSFSRRAPVPVFRDHSAALRPDQSVKGSVRERAMSIVESPDGRLGSMSALSTAHKENVRDGESASMRERGIDRNSGSNRERERERTSERSSLSPSQRLAPLSRTAVSPCSNSKRMRRDHGSESDSTATATQLSPRSTTSSLCHSTTSTSSSSTHLARSSSPSINVLKVLLSGDNSSPDKESGRGEGRGGETGTGQGVYRKVRPSRVLSSFSSPNIVKLDGPHSEPQSGAKPSTSTTSTYIIRNGIVGIPGSSSSSYLERQSPGAASRPHSLSPRRGPLSTTHSAHTNTNTRANANSHSNAHTQHITHTAPTHSSTNTHTRLNVSDAEGAISDLVSLDAHQSGRSASPMGSLSLYGTVSGPSSGARSLCYTASSLNSFDTTEDVDREGEGGEGEGEGEGEGQKGRHRVVADLPSPLSSSSRKLANVQAALDG